MDLKRLKKFYRNKKVFITGHTGFKGIWLYLFLKFLGAKVIGYSLKIKKNDNFNFFKSIKNNVNSIYGDILDYKLLKKSLNSFNPEIVFHLAAQSIVITSQKDPENTFDTNVIGTYNLLKTLNELKSIKSIVIASSDKCYENNDNKKFFNENSKLGGSEPYSFSKALTEQLVYLFRKNILKKNTAISTVRAGNVIGGGDFSKYRLIPDIIKNYNKKKIILRNPKSIRPWQHVFDVCTAYLLIPIFHYKNKMKYSGPYNVGPNNKKLLNVSKLTTLFLNCFNSEYRIYKRKLNFIESKYLFLNSNKIKKNLFWRQKYSIVKSLVVTAEWYKNYLKKRNVYHFSNNQICKYFNLL